MSVLKSSLFVSIIFAALTAALTVKGLPCFDCTTGDLYYFNGSVYLPAGDYGWDFYCNGNTGVCVYYKPDPIFNPDYYAPCKYGIYTMIQ